MITRAKARRNKGTFSAQQSIATATVTATIAAPRVAKSKPMCKTPVMPLFGKSSEKDIIESTARKAAENHMHLNIHKFTPTINQAVKIAVRQELDDAIPKIVEQVIKVIEAKQIAAQVGTSTPSTSNGMVYRTITAAETRTVMAAVPAVTWRQCPKGHCYAVGDCGKPVQAGKCIECKENLF
ncbi:hypothetical protein GGF42_007894 [Coemansia sp. RSA 2424]|nr:hypothetical protein GGF42_007894 [Coemansia sp. RSA 2424]